MQLDEIENIPHSSDSSQFFAVIIANPTSGNGGFPYQNRHFDDTRARNVLVNGQTRRIDLGCVNGRYFLLMVGIGFDGEVTQAVEGKPLKRLGVLGYTLAVLWLGPGYRGFPVVAQIDRYVVKT